MNWYRTFQNRRVRLLIVDEKGTRAMCGTLEVKGAGYIGIGGRMVEAWRILKCEAV